MRVDTIYISIFTCILFGFSGCGGGGDDLSRGFVNDVRVDPDSSKVGSTASVQVDFDPNTFFDGDDESESVEDTTLTVLLPPGVNYITDSSEFDGSILDGFDPRPPNSVILCNDGSRALTYEFSSGELSSLGSNRVRINVTPFEAAGTVEFIAEVDFSIGTPCGIFGQDSDTLIIVP